MSVEHLNCKQPDRRQSNAQQAIPFFIYVCQQVIRSPVITSKLNVNQNLQPKFSVQIFSPSLQRQLQCQFFIFCGSQPKGSMPHLIQLTTYLEQVRLPTHQPFRFCLCSIQAKNVFNYFAEENQELERRMAATLNYEIESD